MSNSSDAARIQGPGPNPNDGYPIDANVVAIPPFSGVVTDIEDGAGVSIMDAGLNAARVEVINGASPIIVTVADGADVAEGATTDAAVSSDANGTVNAHIRGLVKILANVWDSVNGWLKVRLTGPDAQSASLALGVGTSNVISVDYGYDEQGTVFRRGNVNETVIGLAVAAHTTTQTIGVVRVNRGNRFLIIVQVNGVGTGTITPSLQVYDPNTGNATTIWTGAAIPAVGFQTYTYYFADGALGTGGAFTAVLPFGLPGNQFNIVLTKSDASSWTFGASYGVMTS